LLPLSQICVTSLTRTACSVDEWGEGQLPRVTWGLSRNQRFPTATNVHGVRQGLFQLQVLCTWYTWNITPKLYIYVLHIIVHIASQHVVPYRGVENCALLHTQIAVGHWSSYRSEKKKLLSPKTSPSWGAYVQIFRVHSATQSHTDASMTFPCSATKCFATQGIIVSPIDEHTPSPLHSHVCVSKPAHPPSGIRLHLHPLFTPFSLQTPLDQPS
jgi:hypothetical protein